MFVHCLLGLVATAILRQNKTAVLFFRKRQNLIMAQNRCLLPCNDEHASLICKACATAMSKHKIKNEFIFRCAGKCGEFFATSCLERQRISNTPIKLPVDLLLFVDSGNELEFNYVCADCEGKCIPLPVQLLRQQLISWIDIMDYYRTDAGILAAIKICCDENGIDLSLPARARTAVNFHLEDEDVEEDSEDLDFAASRADAAGTSEETFVPNSVFSSAVGGAATTPVAENLETKGHIPQETEVKKVFPSFSADVPSTSEVADLQTSNASSNAQMTDMLNMMMRQNQLLMQNLVETQQRNEATQRIERDRQWELFDKILTTNAKDDDSKNSEDFCKLPRKSLSTFSGTVLEYRPFIELFEALVHKNPRLPAVQKFHYLLDCLRGEAKSSVDGIPVTGENYELAREILEKRFGDETKVRDEYVKALESIPPVYKSLLVPLQRYYDAFLKYYRGLCAYHKNQTEEVDKCYWVVQRKLFNKLPFDFREKLLDKDEACSERLSVFSEKFEEVLVRLRKLDSTFSSSSGTNSIGKASVPFQKNESFQRGLYTHPQGQYRNRNVPQSRCFKERLLCKTPHLGQLIIR